MRMFLLVFALVPISAVAQSYDDIVEAHPESFTMLVRAPNTPVYEGASENSRMVTRLSVQTELLVYGHEGEFYAVARPRFGAIGFIRQDAVIPPAGPRSPVVAASPDLYYNRLLSKPPEDLTSEQIAYLMMRAQHDMSRDLAIIRTVQVVTLGIAVAGSVVLALVLLAN